MVSSGACLCFPHSERTAALIPPPLAALDFRKPVLLNFQGPVRMRLFQKVPIYQKKTCRKAQTFPNNHFLRKAEVCL